jgi:hypothetical protein
MNRALWAFSLGAVVTGAQVLAAAAGLVVIAAVGLVSWALAVPVALAALVLATAVAPAVVHNHLSATRFASTMSMRATILLAFAGLALGQLAGTMFERGHLRGGGWQSMIGAVVGSFLSVSLANLRAPRPERSLRVDLVERQP